MKSSQLNKAMLGLCALVFMVASHASSAETLKVCYDQWPPMTIFPTAKEPRRGVVIDMFSDIYQRAGISLEFYQVPYARGMQMVQDGLCDVLPEKEFSPLADAGYVYANEETFRYPTAFVVRRDDPWRYKGVQSVQGRRVATGPGWNYSSMSEVYQAYLDNPLNQDFVEIVSGESDVVDRIMLMIIEGLVDLYADNLFVLQYLLQVNGLSEKLKIVTPGLENKLVEKPIFSLKLDSERRERLMNIWDKGRNSMTPAQEASLLKGYGIDID